MFKKYRWGLVLMALGSVFFYVLQDQSMRKSPTEIHVSGAMSAVMWQGQLGKTIDTDSLDGSNTYGLGPMAYLEGEVLVLEGQTFISKAVDSTHIVATAVPSTGAPFFVYMTNSHLEPVSWPLADYNLNSLEAFIDQNYVEYKAPLLIRVDGVFDSLELHTVNLPKGSTVSNPEQAHQGLVRLPYSKIKGSLIGFFSRHHQSIFTHHDSFLHAHFISEDRSVMGHVDAANFSSESTSLRVSN